jgi:hypothetical protein
MPRCPALAPAERQKRVAETVLGRGPLQRDALAGPFRQGFTKGRDRLLQPLRAALALAEFFERVAKIALGQAVTNCRALRVHVPTAW